MIFPTQKSRVNFCDVIDDFSNFYSKIENIDHKTRSLSKTKKSDLSTFYPNKVLSTNNQQSISKFISNNFRIDNSLYKDMLDKPKEKKDILESKRSMFNSRKFFLDLQNNNNY